MSSIRRKIVDLQSIISEADGLLDSLVKIEVTSNNYSEASDAKSLLEVYEASIRWSRQRLELKLREQYINQYLELHRKMSTPPQIQQHDDY